MTDSGAFSDYHALQLELRRRLSRGLSANINYQYALEGGSAFDGFSFGRAHDADRGNVRHAIKTQWDWTLPVGRGQRFGDNLHPILDAVARRLELQRRRPHPGARHRLRQRAARRHDARTTCRACTSSTSGIDPATGLQTVYMLPDDIILNTRRAFSVSTTTLNGYSTSLGAPEGRYIAPANSANCIQIKAGDCAPRDADPARAVVHARSTSACTKKFPIHGRTNIEFGSTC